MNIRTEIRLGIGALLALLLVVAGAGIGLLERMAPAIERILLENVYSTESSEAMLMVFAEHPGAVPAEGRTRYHAALRRIRSNVTHRKEQPLAARLTELAPRALQGDVDARRRSILALRALAQLNRVEIKRADRRAQQVGERGAWSMVALGLAGVLLSLIVFRRVLGRLLLPLREISAVLSAAVDGDPHRRAHLTEAPEDLRLIAQDLNRVLDHPTTTPGGEAGVSSRRDQPDEPREGRARQPDP